MHTFSDNIECIFHHSVRNFYNSLRYNAMASPCDSLCNYKGSPLSTSSGLPLLISSEYPNMTPWGRPYVTPPYGPICNAKGCALPTSSGCPLLTSSGRPNMTTWRRPNVTYSTNGPPILTFWGRLLQTSWERPRMVPFETPRELPYWRQRLPEEVFLRCPKNVLVWFNHLFFCNHFEELQTVLFEVELIINNAPLT